MIRPPGGCSTACASANTRSNSAADAPNAHSPGLMLQAVHRDACAANSVAQAFPILAPGNRMRMQQPACDFQIARLLAAGPHRPDHIEKLFCHAARLVFPSEMKQRGGFPSGKR